MELDANHGNLDYELLGARIRSRREAMKITQKNLAAAVSCSVTHISNIENNYNIPSLEVVLRLCEELKITPDYLLLGIDRSDGEDDWIAIKSKLLLCTQEQRRFFRRLLELTVEENKFLPNE